jgi:hypothetical protein
MMERRGHRTGMVIALAISGWLMTQLLMAATEPYGREQSGVALAKALRPALTPDTPVYAVGTYEQSMTFYMAHKVTTVAFTDELLRLAAGAATRHPDAGGIHHCWKPAAQACRNTPSCATPCTSTCRNARCRWSSAAANA